MLWPIIFGIGVQIAFAHTSFAWSNNAARNAGVTCVIVGLATYRSKLLLFEDGVVREVQHISPYLVPTRSIIVSKKSKPISEVGLMQSGNKATDDGNLICTTSDKVALGDQHPEIKSFTKRYIGSKELINGGDRWCFWIENDELEKALSIPALKHRIEAVQKFRSASRGKQANENAGTPHRFVFAPHAKSHALVVANVSSERREYLPCSVTDYWTVVSNLASVIYGAPIWNMALIASRLHWAWISTVCGSLKLVFAIRTPWAGIPFQFRRLPRRTKPI